MNIEYQLQIDAIKGTRIYYKDFENFIFITDGHIGVYLKERELKIDRTKMIAISEGDQFNPENLSKERTAAIETKIARKLPLGGYAIKFYSEESGKHCYIQEKFLKMFKGYTGASIKERRDPVLLYKYGVPYGIILPMNIAEQEDKQ